MLLRLLFDTLRMTVQGEPFGSLRTGLSNPVAAAQEQRCRARIPFDVECLTFEF